MISGREKGFLDGRRWSRWWQCVICRNIGVTATVLRIVTIVGGVSTQTDASWHGFVIAPNFTNEIGLTIGIGATRALASSRLRDARRAGILYNDKGSRWWTVTVVHGIDIAVVAAGVIKSVGRDHGCILCGLLLVLFILQMTAGDAAMIGALETIQSIITMPVGIAISLTLLQQLVGRIGWFTNVLQH